MADTTRVTVPVEPTEAVSRIRAYVVHAEEINQGAILVATSDLKAMLTAAPVREEGGAVSGPGGYLVKDFADGWYWTPNAALDHASGAPVWSVADNRYETDPPALATREEAPAEAGEVFHANLMSHEDNEAWRKLDERAQPQAREEAGPAELEVGRVIYEGIEKLIGAKPGTRDGEELHYLSDLVASVEEVDGYDGPQAREEAQPDDEAWHYTKDCPALSPAPEAEKLRVAVEALEEARDNLIQCGDHFGAGQCADAISLIALSAAPGEAGE